MSKGDAEYERLGTDVTWTETPTHTLDFVDENISVAVFLRPEEGLVILVNGKVDEDPYTGKVRVVLNSDREVELGA